MTTAHAAIGTSVHAFFEKARNQIRQAASRIIGPEALTAGWSRSRQASRIIVFDHLARLIRSRGLIEVSYAGLADSTGYSERTCRYAIEDLAAVGAIDVYKRPKVFWDRAPVNLYCLGRLVRMWFAERLDSGEWSSTSSGEFWMRFRRELLFPVLTLLRYQALRAFQPLDSTANFAGSEPDQGLKDHVEGEQPPTEDCATVAPALKGRSALLSAPPLTASTQPRAACAAVGGLSAKVEAIVRLAAAVAVAGGLDELPEGLARALDELPVSQRLDAPALVALASVPLDRAREVLAMANRKPVNTYRKSVSAWVTWVIKTGAVPIWRVRENLASMPDLHVKNDVHGQPDTITAVVAVAEVEKSKLSPMRALLSTGLLDRMPSALKNRLKALQKEGFTDDKIL